MQRCELLVAPELSGNEIQMIDKRTGKDALRHAYPGERSYPDVGGLGVSVYSDYLAAKPNGAKWELEPQTQPTELAAHRHLCQWAEGAARHSASE